MEKNSKKVAKKNVKAQAKLAVEQAAVGPILSGVIEGVSEETRLAWEAYRAEKEKKVVSLVNDGPDTIIVTVNQEQFNRAGFDILMASTFEQQTEVKQAVVTAPVSKKHRVKDGFLGLTRRLYVAGKNGQEVLQANIDARLAAGYTPEKALERAKKDYGYIVREAHMAKAQSDNTVEVKAVAV